MQGLQNDVPGRVLKFRWPTRKLYTFGPSAPTNDQELSELNLLGRFISSCLGQLSRA